MKIGHITLGDRAAADKNGPEIEKALGRIFEGSHEFVREIVPVDSDRLRAVLVRFCDQEKCPLVVTTGGTGPGPRDIAPETTRLVLDRELPGFGEVMRYYSYERVPSAIPLPRDCRHPRPQPDHQPARPPPARWPSASSSCAKRWPRASSSSPVSGRCFSSIPSSFPLEKYLPFLKRLRPKGPFIESAVDRPSKALAPRAHPGLRIFRLVAARK